MANALIDFPPGALLLLETNVPQRDIIDFGTVIAEVLRYDDTTEEYANGRFAVPGEINTGGTVTFRAKVSPATGAASKNVALTFGHAARATGEAIDASYTDEDSGDKAITATTGQATFIEWTETVSNLAWAADDEVFFRLSRYDASTNDLSGDMYLLSFQIEIPLS